MACSELTADQGRTGGDTSKSWKTQAFQPQIYYVVQVLIGNEWALVQAAVGLLETGAYNYKKQGPDALVAGIRWGISSSV